MSEKTRRIFRSTRLTVGFLVNTVAILLFLLALLAPYISPTYFSIPSFLNLGFLPLLFLVLVFVVWHLVLRHWYYLAVYALLLALSFGYIRTYVPFHLTNTKGRENLRLMTYNVMGFSRKAGDKVLAAKRIKGEHPDIVCIQEAAGSKKWYEREFGKIYPYIDTPGEGHNIGRLALLSKYPIIHRISIPSPSIGNGSVVYLLTLPSGKSLLLLNNHLESYKLTNRELEGYKGVIKDREIKGLPGLTKSIYSRLWPGLKRRAASATHVSRELHRLVEQYKPDAVIVAGDFNDTPMSYTYSKMRQHYHDAYVETGWGPGLTYSRGPLRFRIDHIFYSGSLKATKTQIIRDRAGSDHYPMVASFELLPQ